MQKDDQNFWNIIFSLFFLAVAVCMIRSLYLSNGELPTTIPVFDLLLLILATFRLTRLFVYDKITHFLRDMFQHVDEVYTQEGVRSARRMNFLFAHGAFLSGQDYL